MPHPALLRRMGTRPSFNPNDYGGGSLRGWFKADSLNLADGASVTAWVDSSGNGNDASGGTSPTYKVGIQNGKPGVLFTRASSQYLRADGVAAVSSGTDLPYTVVHVIKPVTLSTGVTHIFSGWGSTASTVQRCWNYSNNAQYNSLRRDDANVQLTSSTAGIETTNAQVLTYHYSGTLMNVWRDGVQVSTNMNTDVGLMTLNNFTLGASLAVATPANFYDGHMLEIIIYAAAISDSGRVTIERAMGLKWGIPVL